jgi:hypothetical protein
VWSGPSVIGREVFVGVADGGGGSSKASHWLGDCGKLSVLPSIHFV